MEGTNEMMECPGRYRARQAEAAVRAHGLYSAKQWQALPRVSSPLGLAHQIQKA